MYGTILNSKQFLIHPNKMNSSKHKMCLNKQKYYDQIQAFIAITKIKTKYNHAASTDLRSYECPRCRKWHLTKQPLKFPLTNIKNPV